MEQRTVITPERGVFIASPVAAADVQAKSLARQALHDFIDQVRGEANYSQGSELTGFRRSSYTTEIDAEVQRRSGANTLLSWYEVAEGSSHGGGTRRKETPETSGMMERGSSRTAFKPARKTERHPPLYERGESQR